MTPLRSPDQRPAALTIAGLDPGGGAGLVADIKTFAAEGVWGCAVATALTFQNTSAVLGFESVDSAAIESQIEALLNDIPIGGIKIGMVGSVEASDAIVRTIGSHADDLGATKIVIDPVLASSTGGSLAESGLATAMIRSLVPMADLVTPNLDELDAMLGERPTSSDEIVAGAQLLRDAGAGAVLVTGATLEKGAVTDIFVGSGEPRFLSSPRIESSHNHGTGCVLSAGIAAGFALGDEISVAVERGRSRVRSALMAGFALGGGAGPIDPLG